MRDFGLFNTLVVDELLRSVRLGPTAKGEWIDVGNWGEDEWDVLVAIVSHPRGASAHDVVRHSRGLPRADRQTVFRIRRRFRMRQEIPPPIADAVIISKRGTNSYILNPQINLRMIPGRIVGAGEQSEPRAFDVVLHAIKRASLELFGYNGFQKTIDALPDDVRRDTVEISHGPGRWIPLRYITSWIRAAREGAAAFSLNDYQAFLRTMERYRLLPYFDQYFRSSRKHRLSNIQDMWQTCYDSGKVEAIVSPTNDWYEIRLWNHPFAQTEMARRTHGYCWLSLSEALGAHDCVLEACDVEVLSGALRIRIAGDIPNE